MIYRDPLRLLSPGGDAGASNGAAEAKQDTTAGADGAKQAGSGQSPSRQDGGTPQNSGIPEDPAQLKARLEYEISERSRLATVHEEMKAKYAKREAEEERGRQETLKKAGEFEKLYAEMAPKYETAASQAKRQEAALAAYYEAELKVVPENMKALIPEGDIVSRLEWITKAKAAGAIAQGVKGRGPDGTPPPNGASVLQMTRDAFDAMTPTEKRDFILKGGKLA